MGCLGCCFGLSFLSCLRFETKNLMCVSLTEKKDSTVHVYLFQHVEGDLCDVHVLVVSWTITSNLYTGYMLHANPYSNGDHFKS